MRSRAGPDNRSPINSSAETANDAALKTNAPSAPIVATRIPPIAGPIMIARWKVALSTPLATASSSPVTIVGSDDIIAGWKMERNEPSTAATTMMCAHESPFGNRSDATAAHRTISATTMTLARGYRSAIGPAIVSPTTVEVTPSTVSSVAIARTNAPPCSVAVNVIATARL